MSEKVIIIVIFAVFAAIEIWQGRFGDKALKTRDDAVVESLSLLALLTFTQPMILFLAGEFAGSALPQMKDALENLPWLYAVLLFLVFDDMMQYWWHRACHTFPVLYPLHRAHHNAPYMSVRIVYRNNLFFYFLMPGIWFSGILIYLGLGSVYAGYLVVKLLVITSAHSSWQWDAALYKIPKLSPLMWVIERTISTPSTHSAHHGRHQSDPATHYKGNYGNLLFFWDVLFGTSKITRKCPSQFGVEGLKPVDWKQQLFWPFKR